MRFIARSLAAVLLAAGAASCSDTRTINTPIPPGKHAGRIALTPEFSPAARAIAARLGDFGLTFDQVRVTIRNNPDTTLVVLDTTVTFRPSSADLRLDLTVPVDVDGQVFNALVEYLDEGDPVYAGSILVTSYAPDQSPPEQQNLVLNFVGPGSTLKTITITPDRVNLVGAQTVPITITATDSSDAAIALPPLVFTSSDESIADVGGTETERVVESFGKRGSARLIVTTPTGIADTIDANVTLPASKLVVVSGAGQTATVGTALADPAVVQVSADDDVGVAGVTVTFAAPIGGSVGSASVVTDENGRASTTLTLATTAGPQSFAVSATGLTAVALAETALPGPAAPTTSTISSDVVQINADNASPATITVQAKDQYGNVVTTGGAAVTLTTSLGHWGATGSATTVAATDVGNGTYTATLFTAQSGVASITGTIGGVAIGTPPASVNAIATILDHFDVTKDDGNTLAPTEPAGTTINVRITARDASGNTVASYTGQPSLTVTNSTFLDGSPITAPAAVNGVSTVAVRFGQLGTSVVVNAAGVQGQVTKTGQSAPFDVVTGPPSVIVPAGRFAPSPDSTIILYDQDSSPEVYPTIRITDGAGNPVGGKDVTFGLTPGQQCELVGSPTHTSDGEGIVALNEESITIPTVGADFPFSCHLTVAASGFTATTLNMALIVQPYSGTTWLGRIDNSWETKDNWTLDLPSSSSHVFIPASQPRLLSLPPQLNNDEIIGSVDIEEAGLLNLNQHDLGVFGDIDTRTGAITNGSLRAIGNGGSLRGNLPSVSCQSGSYFLTGLTEIAQSLNVTGCSLNLAGQFLGVVQDFSMSNGSLTMNSSGDALEVFGNATFGSPTPSELTAGTLLVLGNLTQTGARNFAPSGTHQVAIGAGGQASQTVAFSDVQSSWFQNLSIILVNGKTVAINSPVQVHGTLIVAGLNGGLATGGVIKLPLGLANQTNGPIELDGSMTIDVGAGGIINTSSLSIGGGTVTLTGAGQLALANGSLRLGDNLNLVINTTGTLISERPAQGCTVVGTNVKVLGTNTEAIKAIKTFCGIP